ncbi:MAG: tail fiber protein [Arcobacteraceae bacterium]|nr:tail fiber protein [Arcobacteraceae bacterium]
MEYYTGMIIQVGFDFAARGNALCQGQSMSVNQNPALFALLGTTYGGDGRTTFWLLDLRGRAAIGAGQGSGLRYWDYGESDGTETHTMTTPEMPAHTHLATFTPIVGGDSDPITATVTVNANAGVGNQNSPAGGYLATGVVTNGMSSSNVEKGYSNTKNTTMASDAVQVNISGGGGGITGGTVTNGTTGSSQPFSIMQPILAINYQIVLSGIFPARN